MVPSREARFCMARPAEARQGKEFITMDLFGERNVKYDSFMGAVAVSLIWFASSGAQSGITNELFIIIPIVFIISCGAFYYYLSRKVKEEAGEING